ncbi:MAG: dihydrodipicolinate reductase [Gordonia sp.]|uniref:Dihydrodipicolinate reductase n=1 Tax=Gordonia rubripertincta TaxID=36822 RepID=A0ABT4MWT6_GORRU|nr:dihydrodipicolinate reductase [Gordonia rubripertincta]MBA4023710.1 dihydrodipicolinate reductase [Gordonia sp. (in: high G+C Gram-positive bacteria)]MCZ4551274.1 dihydrodipicolinate reductase [Gordonia rubripertincta]
MTAATDGSARADTLTTRPYRVVQWATGNIGTKSLRGVIEHPSFTLAGVYVHSAEKAGLDAGQLCGLGQTGVIATNSLDDIVALAPDCVLYMAAKLDTDEVCRLLGAGINVVTTRGEFHHPASMAPELRAAVEEACRRGNTSIHSTGSSPGFITEAIPLVLTSIQRRLDLITIDEYADLSSRNSPELLFDIMGFGQEPGEFSEARLSHARNSFGPSLRLVADGIGLPLDSIEAEGEIALTRADTPIAAGVVKAGTVAAQRISAIGMRNGKAVLRFRATWYCTQDFDQDWELLPTGWRVTVDGDAPLEVDIKFPIELEDMAATTPGYTANRAVNAVPFVCAATAGIRTATDLPQIIAALG